MKSSIRDRNRSFPRTSHVVVIVGVLLFFGGMSLYPATFQPAAGFGKALSGLAHLALPARAMAAQEAPSPGRFSEADTAGKPMLSVKRSWVKFYNNSKYNLTDFAKAIALDKEGNVVVTGSSTTETVADIVTIKYRPDGTESWTAVYNGPGDGSDVPMAIAIDSLNNIIVVGGSLGAGTNSDYVIIKYSPAGKELWAKRYDGPVHGFDAATSVAVDTQNNIYVTGSSDPTGLGNLDYLTVKYDAKGHELWTARYDGPSKLVDTALAITVDSSGNPCVTGQSNGTLKTKIDIATIKYNSATGAESWVKRYDGPQHYFDVGRAIVADSKGNVYVAGEASVGATQDFVTIKYNAAGKELWVKHYNGAGDGADFAKAVAVDSKGYVCVAGDVWGTDTDWDFGVVKYRISDGAESWVATYDGAAHLREELKGMVVDKSANVYVAGYSLNQTNADLATVKFNTSGQRAWTQRYNGAAKDEDVPFGIVVDSSKNVYVTGYTTDADSREDYVTIKYAEQ